MNEPERRRVIEQLPAWMGRPLVFIVFGVLLLAGFYNFASALVGFTTWFHVVWSAISTALFLWLFLLTFGAWRRTRASTASTSNERLGH